MSRTAEAILAAVVFALLVVAVMASAAWGDLADCCDATCRVTAGKSRGTGCVFEISQGHVFVLTNAHVVGAASTVQCEFWRDGHQSQPIAGRVVYRSEAVDGAVVSCLAEAFGSVLPTAIPIAAKDLVLAPGATIMSVGCPRGEWPTAWTGHVLGYQGGDLHFVPVPANGRSGSAVFDAAGERIVGLLRARTMDDSQGIAVPVQHLYRIFGRCEPGKPCPPQQPSPQPWQQGPVGPSNGEPWPTRPQQPAPAPIPPQFGELLLPGETPLLPIPPRPVVPVIPQPPSEPVPPPAVPDPPITPGPSYDVDERLGGLKTMLDGLKERVASTDGFIQGDGFKVAIGEAISEQAPSPLTGILTAGLAALGVSAPVAAIGLWLARRGVRRVIKKRRDPPPLPQEEPVDRLEEARRLIVGLSRKVRDLDRRDRPPAAEGPAGIDFPERAPRETTEAEELVRLSQLEGRDPLHDGLLGLLVHDEIGKVIAKGGQDAGFAKDLLDTLEDRFNSILPLKLKPKT